MFTQLTIVVVCWLPQSPASIACINTYGTDLHGHTTEFLEEPSYLADQLRRIEIDRTHWSEVEARLTEGLEAADFKHRSDYAAALIYLGRYEEAIGILEEVERQHPGEYIVATNLGTAYELSGNLERALLWIQTGFERNPDAHAGSEWLHVKILEARLQLEADPEWLKTHTVLGIDLGRQPAPSPPNAGIVDTRGTSHNLDDVRGAIEYQLHERLKFVSPQDPVVADLLFDLGNILALTSSVEQAIPVYRFAREYGVQNLSLLGQRIQHYQALAAANPRSGESVGGQTLETLLYVVGSCFGFLVLVPVAFLTYRHFSRRRATGE